MPRPVSAPREAALIVDTAEVMIARGAAALLLEAVPDEVAEGVVRIARDREDGEPIPVIGCGAGPACHGHVVVLHDLLKLSDWQPPFAPPAIDLGSQVQAAAAAWVKAVSKGDYLRDGGVYRTDALQPAIHSVDWDGRSYAITRAYRDDANPREDGAVEFRHYMDDLFKGLIDRDLAIVRIDDLSKIARPPADAAPGSWAHQEPYVGGLFTILAQRLTRSPG